MPRGVRGTLSHTRSAYVNGRCKCDICKEAARQYQARWTERVTARVRETGALPAGVEHGTVNAYQNYGCRCEPCGTAWAERARKRPAKRRSGQTAGRQSAPVTAEQLRAALALLAAGVTVSSAAKELAVTERALRYALSSRGDYPLRYTKRLKGVARVELPLRIDPDVFAAMRERAATDRLMNTELVNAALRSFLEMDA